MAEPHPIPKDYRFQNLTGQRFGHLQVVSFAGRRHWNCVCRCGAERAVFVNNLKRGFTTSCGCVGRQACITHGATRGYRSTPTYRCWIKMLGRCHNPKAREFPRYGGRGIVVCEQWRGRNGFARFLADLGPRPSLRHGLDRIENDKGYEPGNVRWATNKENCRNKRKHHVATYHGKSQCIAAWAEELGVHEETVRYRARHRIPLDAPTRKKPPVKALHPQPTKASSSRR